MPKKEGLSFEEEFSQEERLTIEELARIYASKGEFAIDRANVKINFVRALFGDENHKVKIMMETVRQARVLLQITQSDSLSQLQRRVYDAGKELYFDENDQIFKIK